MKKIIIDSGPLIALFNGNDIFHEKAKKFVKSNNFKLISSLATITEVAYVLDFNINAQYDFLKWVSFGGIEICPIENHDLLKIGELMMKYNSVPMDFADGVLICICENLNIRDIATIDSDFEIYRFRNKFKFRNLFKQ